jgi:uncharacterized membrane protein
MPRHKNLNHIVRERLTRGQKIADAVTGLIGSWKFVIGCASVLTVWAALNALAGARAIDPYPYTFLNLLLGIFSVLSSSLIMLSQNRSQQRERLRADQEHELAVQSEGITEEVLKNQKAILKTLSKGNL